MTYRKADVSSLRMLRRARDRIDRDYREEIAVAALASDAGYSREHFIRAFRAAYGDTSGRYRTRRRVERARELPRSANLTVTEICYLVSFSSLVQLHRAETTVVVTGGADVPGGRHRGPRHGRE